MHMQRHVPLAPILACLLALAGLLFLTSCASLQSSSGTDQEAAGSDTAASQDPDSPLGSQLSDLEQENIDLEPGVEITEDQDPRPLTPEQKQALETEPEINFHLDVHENKEFLIYFKSYTGRYASGSPKKMRRVFAKWLDRSETYLPYIRDVFRERGLPEDLCFLPFAESGFNPWAYSRAGAAGLWQFMPYTGRRYGLTVNWWIDERRDPYKATHAAANLLRDLHERFGDWYLALAGYNAGEGKVSWAMRRTGTDNFFDLAKHRGYLKLETRHYVPKFLATIKIVRNLESLGFDPLDWDSGSGLADLSIQGGTDLLAMAKTIGMSWKQFHQLNPAFRRYVSPPDHQTTVYLPPEKVAGAREYLAQAKSRPYEGYHRYRIRYGDSWWRLSRSYGVPISILKRVNSTRSNLLHPGQWVMIPGSKQQRIVSTPKAKTRAYARKRANYTVRSGDTLWDISQRHGVNLNTLRRANGLGSGRYLKPGQKLYIPNYTPEENRRATREAETLHRTITYQVRKGDTLWEIARRFGVTTRNLQAWNNLNGKLIHPGDTLKVHVR
jgi:membrane-bound lytic murein transglycosylase D